MIRPNFPLFSKVVSDYLGDHQLFIYRDDYGMSEAIIVKCKDGRLFQQSISGYAMAIKNPYKNYMEAHEMLIEKIRKHMEPKNLPIMDRKMREIYGK